MAIQIYAHFVDILFTPCLFVYILSARFLYSEKKKSIAPRCNYKIELHRIIKLEFKFYFSTTVKEWISKQ
jgi:hypothetical protein